MGFPDPAVSTGFVHQLLSALPNIVDAACGCASFLRERHRRFVVTLAVRHQCPDRPGSLVRQGNRSDFLRAPGKQLDEPPALSTVPLDMADHDHSADYQHLAQIAVACPRDAAEPLLARTAPRRGRTNALGPHRSQRRLSISRTRCSIMVLCCSGVFTATNLIVGRETASQIAAASAASFFPRLT